jgi:hypothetical protein
VAEDAASLPGQRAHSTSGSYPAAVRCLSCDVVYRPSGDGRNRTKQLPGSGIAVKAASHLADATGEVRRQPGNSLRDARERLLGCGCHSLGHDGQKLAGGHANQRQKLLGCLVLRLGLGGKFSEVFHHRVGVDLPDGAEFLFAFFLAFKFPFRFLFALELTLFFALGLVLELTFAEQAAHHVSDGAEPAFTFGLVFEFAFRLGLELLLEFRQDFGFVL